MFFLVILIKNFYVVIFKNVYVVHSSNSHLIFNTFLKNHTNYFINTIQQTFQVYLFLCNAFYDQIISSF